MRARSLDKDHDWQFGKGVYSYRRELDALKQNLETRLLSSLGDCFSDQAEGVNWNAYLDIGTKNLLDIDILRVVNSTGGVIKVTRYESSMDLERNIHISMNILSVYGGIEIEL